MPTEPNATIDLPLQLGKYEIRGVLGSGSMGMVFDARDPVLERDVAIKVMAGSSLLDESMRRRFEREAKAVAQLHHPNIVTVYDLGYDDRDSPFIAMERLEGDELDTLAAFSPLSIEQKLDLVMQVCWGLQHAHKKGIVHRDIKPANIFVTSDGSAKIMDFGVARWSQTHQTQAGIVVGTAGYISPEQLRAEDVDGRCDVFSLGAVLYELLTGTALYPGENLEAIFFQTLTKPVPRVALPDGTEVPGLQTILDRALAKVADERYDTAMELAEAIRVYTTEHPDVIAQQSLRVGPGEAVEPRARRPSSPQPTRRITPPPYLRDSGPGDVPAVRRTPRPRGHTRPGRASRPARRWPWFAVVGGVVVAGSVALLPGRWPAPEVGTESTSTPANAPLVMEPASNASVSEPDPRGEATALLADAALLIGSGDVDDAQELIRRAESLDPENPRFELLGSMLDEKRAELERIDRAAVEVRAANALFARGAVESAVAGFEKALVYDPASREARVGLELARETLDAETARPVVTPSREFVESVTVYTPAEADVGLEGFQMEERFEVGETTDPFFPVKLVIELEPKDASPGDAYTVRVLVVNEGYRPVALDGLELVSTFGERTTGNGQRIALSTRAVAAQATTVVHEIVGSWKESQNRGAFVATVILADGGRLEKTLSW